MGWDIQSIPIRLDAPAVRRIRADAELWEIADCHPPFWVVDEEDLPIKVEELPEISRELLACFPDPPFRTDSFPYRDFEQAEYLLDPPAFRAITSWEERQRTLPFRIIQGDEVFAEHARGAQGGVFRCSSASFLAEAAATIDALDVAAARREFSVADMRAQGVYKLLRSDDDEAFDQVLKGLRNLADHYRRTAAGGWDLLVVVD